MKDTCERFIEKVTPLISKEDLEKAKEWAEKAKQELGRAHTEYAEVELTGRQKDAELTTVRQELETLRLQHEELKTERNKLQQPAQDSTADRTQPISPARTAQTFQTDGMSVMSRMPRETPYLVELVLPPGLSWRSMGKPLFHKWIQATGGDATQVKYIWKVAGKKKVIMLACMEDGIGIDDLVEQFEEAADAVHFLRIFTLISILRFCLSMNSECD